MEPRGAQYKEAAQEDRCSPHVSISLKTSLRPSGQRSFETWVIDLSRAGFAAWCNDDLPVGTVCWLTLPGVKGARSEVVWWDNRFVGCAFSELLDQAIYDEIVDHYGRDDA